jgi:hypothetical protein
MGERDKKMGMGRSWENGMFIFVGEGRERNGQKLESR